MDELVVYQAEYYDPEFGNAPIWVRPLEMFLEIIELDGKKVPRFEYIGE